VSAARDPNAGRVGGGPLAIEPMTPADAAAVLAIYEAGIATGHATFQTEVPAWEEWDARHMRSPRLVARDKAGAVLGWCALSPVSRRAVYAGVAEESVYVAPAAHRRGVGRALLEAMCRLSEEAGIWTLQTGIFPENVASIALHEACGFRVLGVRERIGRHMGQGGRWRDVVFLERRSRVAGSE
jgi:phosphinothricin acetyltransferase